MAAEDEPQAHWKGYNRMSKKFPNGEIRIKPAKAAEIVGLDIEKDVVECIECNNHAKVVEDVNMPPGMMFVSQAIEDLLGPGVHKGLYGKIQRIMNANSGLVEVKWNNGRLSTHNVAKLRVTEKPKLKVGDIIRDEATFDAIPLETVLHYEYNPERRGSYSFAMIRTGEDGWQKTDATNLYMTHENAKRIAQGRDLKVLYVPER